eukprot:363662-Chlamydomonas_euryale.AAC.15
MDMHTHAYACRRLHVSGHVHSHAAAVILDSSSIMGKPCMQKHWHARGRAGVHEGACMRDGASC